MAANANTPTLGTTKLLLKSVDHCAVGSNSKPKDGRTSTWRPYYAAMGSIFTIILWSIKSSLYPTQTSSVWTMYTWVYEGVEGGRWQKYNLSQFIDFEGCRIKSKCTAQTSSVDTAYTWSEGKRGGEVGTGTNILHSSWALNYLGGALGSILKLKVKITKSFRKRDSGLSKLIINSIDNTLMNTLIHDYCKTTSDMHVSPRIS